MAFLSHTKKEIKAKVVYYGPGLSGKTSNINYIHNKMRSDHRGDLVNLSTDDRTLFFDFLPVELGNIKGYRTTFHTFTVPGQVFYNETRKAVLKDVDGIVFVADSQKKMRDENTRSLKNLEENLAHYGKKLSDIPHVFQYNKRDMPETLSLEDLHRELNKTKAPFFEAVATNGTGVLNTLKLVSKMVLKKLATSPTGAIEENDEAFEENNFGLSEDYIVVAPGEEVPEDAKQKETVVTAIEIDVPAAEVVEETEEIIEDAEVVAEEGAEIISGSAETPETEDVGEQLAAHIHKTEPAETETAQEDEEGEEIEIDGMETADDDVGTQHDAPPRETEPTEAETAQEDEEGAEIISGSAETPETEDVGEQLAAPTREEELEIIETLPLEETYEAELSSEPVNESEIPTPPGREEVVEEEPKTLRELEPEPEPEPESVPEPVAAHSNTPTAASQPPADQTAPPGNPAPASIISTSKELTLYQWGFPERVDANSIKIPLYFRDNETGQEYWSYITISLDNIMKRL